MNFSILFGVCASASVCLFLPKTFDTCTNTVEWLKTVLKIVANQNLTVIMVDAHENWRL